MGKLLAGQLTSGDRDRLAMPLANLVTHRQLSQRVIGWTWIAAAAVWTNIRRRGSIMRAILVAASLLLPTLVQAAGIKPATIPADHDDPALKAVIWTPCAAAPQEIELGPVVLSGRRDCPTEGRDLPLVVISHGHAGSNLSHHDLAESLADAGFVVAAINHPGDNYADMSRAGEISSFIERPKDIRRLIDYMLTDAEDAGKIAAGRVGFFGFSRGGYTGLVLAGGMPDFLKANVPCEDMSIPLCAQLKRKEVPSGPFIADTRIKAFVLADPLNMFPAADGLKAIAAPIQLWSSEFGGDGVLPGTGQDLDSKLPAKADFHLVPGSGHFAFLVPCSAALMRMASEICVDRGGFDRKGFHDTMNASVVSFFRQHL